MSTDLPFLDISHKRNHTVCGLSRLVSYTFKVCLCWSMYQYTLLLCIATEWSIVCRYTFIHPFFNWWTFGLFPLSSCYKRCCYEHSCTSFRLDVCFHFPWICTKEQTHWSYGTFIFKFLRSCHTVCQNRTILQSHHQWLRVPISPIFPNTCNYLSSWF